MAAPVQIAEPRVVDLWNSEKKTFKNFVNALKKTKVKNLLLHLGTDDAKPPSTSANMLMAKEHIIISEQHSLSS